jgi:hypothetical protein
LISSQNWKEQHAIRLPVAAAMLDVATAAAAVASKDMAAPSQETPALLKREIVCRGSVGKQGFRS